MNKVKSTLVLSGTEVAAPDKTMTLNPQLAVSLVFMEGS